MLQNAGNHPEIGIREARIAPSECPSYNPCTLCMDSAPRASDSPSLCSDPAPPQECRICRMSRPACSILFLLLLMLKLLLLLLLLLLCGLCAWLWGRVGSLHRVSEWELAGQNTCTGCIDYKIGILMVQFALLESRSRGDSLHFGTWCLRLAAQAAGIRT